MSPLPGYIAYIDEAGDDGLARVRSGTGSGASEWFVLAAVLVRAEREADVVRWQQQILRGLNQHQLRELHFQRLPDDKKLWACQQVAQLPLRIFVAISHKKNMEQYVNLHASQSRVNRTAWFYAWMTRILLERVTAYCASRTMRDHGETRPVRIEIAQRGGVRMADVRDYLDLLRKQDAMGLTFLKYGRIVPEVFDPALIASYPCNARAGLQLADIGASAFFAGLERTREGLVRPQFARELRRVVCTRQRRRYEFGFKLMPSGVDHRLPPDQAELVALFKP